MDFSGGEGGEGNRKNQKATGGSCEGAVGVGHKRPEGAKTFTGIISFLGLLEFTAKVGEGVLKGAKCHFFRVGLKGRRPFKKIMGGGPEGGTIILISKSR